MQYTGKRRFDGDDSGHEGFTGRGQIQESPLIGMPRLRHVDKLNVNGQLEYPNTQKTYHSRDRSHLIQSYNQFNSQQQQQQYGHNQQYQKQFQQTTPQPNIQRIIPQLQTSQLQQVSKNSNYYDALDKFMTERTHQQHSQQSQQQSQQQQHQYQQIQQHQNFQNSSDPYSKEANTTPRIQDSNNNSHQSLLTTRNNYVAKSTANLIIKNHIDDNQHSSVKQPQQVTKKSSLLDLKETLKYDQAAQSHSNGNSPHGSPHQVQKKLKEVQSQLNIHMGNVEPSDTYLSKIQQQDSFQKSIKHKKNGALFNINPSTIPENGKYRERGPEGQIKRSLNLAPSTYLGQHHKEEIDDSILNREYTKLGGSNLHVQMPQDLNNMNYHRSNPLKDYTYNNLTGAYYNKVPQ